MTPGTQRARLQPQPGFPDQPASRTPKRRDDVSDTITHPPHPGDQPDAEPATMPLPRRIPGRSYPGRPPIDHAPPLTALEALLAGATGVC